jgi:hypothetical protein
VPPYTHDHEEIKQMKHRAMGVLVLIALAAAAVLGGCGGDPGFIAVPSQTDDVAGTWVVGHQSATLTGTRSAAAVDGRVTFIITQAGVKTWSGGLTDTTGAALSPAFGTWLRAGDKYSLSNIAGQNGSFAWSGSELYSATRRGGETVYLWWTRH